MEAIAKVSTIEQLGTSADLYSYARDLLLVSNAKMVNYGRRGRPAIRLLTVVDAATHSVLHVDNALQPISEKSNPDATDQSLPQGLRVRDQSMKCRRVANNQALQQKLLRANSLPIRIDSREGNFQIIYLIDEDRFVCMVIKPTTFKGRFMSHEADADELRQCAQILIDIGSR